MTPMDQPASTNITWHAGEIPRDQRWRRLGQRGGTVWFTGLSGSGKSTIAAALEAALLRRGVNAYRLDGDNVRHGLNRDLGFSEKDRRENIRRIAETARLFADSGCLALTSFISPFRADRALARQLHEESGLTFIEVFVDTPLGECERRDPKGLYRKARSGEIENFTGIDAPYEPPDPPDAAEITISTPTTDVPAAVERIMQRLIVENLIPPATDDEA